MKKVLIVTNLPSPYRVRFFDALGKYMDVTVLYWDKTGEDASRDADWFENSSGGFHAVALKRRVNFRGQHLCLDVAEWLKKPWDARIICGYSDITAMYAIFYLRRKKLPFYLEVDGGLIRESKGIKYRFKSRLVGSADGWFSTGRETTRYLTHYGAKPEKIHVYPFSSLTQQDILLQAVPAEEKRALREKLGIPGKRMVLSVGRFIPGKGFDVLIRAAGKLHPDTTVCILGGEPTEEYLRLQKEVGAENVRFLGFRKREALKEYYRAADVFTLATRDDVWGLVINEAMAYGLPVVTTDRCVAGVELIENGVSGFIVPTEDAQALASRIRETLEGDTQKMGQAALEKIRGYTIEEMARAHARVLCPEE